VKNRSVAERGKELVSCGMLQMKTPILDFFGEKKTVRCILTNTIARATKHPRIAVALGKGRWAGAENRRF